MIDPKALDELTRKLLDLLPAGMDTLQADLRNNVRAVLTSALSRMDLVSREEFDVQSAVLLRTREKLDKLEEQIAELSRARDAGETTTNSGEESQSDMPSGSDN